MSLFAVFQGPQSIEILARPTHDLAAYDALIEVEACGICGSDVTSYRSGAYVQPGQVMGHEFVGRVVEAGPSARIASGDRVVVRPMRSCQRCWYCRRGDIHLCSSTAELSLSYGLPGGYAEQVYLPSPTPGTDVFALSSEVDALDALWAEPLAVALHAVALAGPVTGRRVLIAGAGSVGLCLITAARLAGATTFVVEPREVRRQLARAIGADHVLADVADITGGPVDVVLDSSGVPAAVQAGVSVTDPGARIVLVGVTHADLVIPQDRVVQGSFGYQQHDFAAAAELVSNGKARLRSAVTHEFDLHSFDDAMTVAASDPEAGKVVIRP